MRFTRRALPVAVAAAALLAPTAAQAATKTVYVGTPPKGALGGVPPTTVDNAFYPNGVKVHAGDSVKFRWATTPHNVLFPPKGKPSPEFAIPSGTAVSGALDAAGAAMWFNGQPGLTFNPQVIAPQGSKTITGKGVHGSGLTLEGKPKDYKVKFAKTGKFTYYCPIHPGMKGTVTVVKKRSTVPSKKDDAKAIKTQTKAADTVAKKLAAFTGPAGNAVQAGSDKGSVTSLAFFPAGKTIHPGESVTFQFSATSTETHNIAFGPDAYLNSQEFVGPGGFNPFVVYPSDPGPLSVTPTSHGNGYASSGLLDAIAASPQPNKQTFTFPVAGTYGYICQVHPFMKGTITVQ